MNVFDLFAKLSLDSADYEKGLDGAESKGKSFASGLGNVLGGAAKAVGAATVAAVGAAATGITSITTQAVNAYGTYEQLIGGVNKIFGESANEVIANAERAYTTAGMSANEYMETVTSFSASLIQSLGGDTVKAAEYADMAISDMSDNANTFGTDISSIQNAYQGFAKQNYTMLDNLKLGYGGTKTEMERLLVDAAALSDEFSLQYDESENLVYGYGDIVEAIHIVQENMAITGTTAKEASSTIQGTAGSLKGAWDNLIIGLGNANADIPPLIDNVVASALKLVNNIKPIAIQAIKGISELIKGIAPVVEKELPPLIEEILPAVTDAIVLLINTVAAVLPSLIKVLLPPVLSAVTNVVISLLQALPTILQLLSSQLPVILQELIPAILEILPSIIEVGISIVITLGQALADNIDLLIGAVMSIIHYLVDELLTPENMMQFIIVSTQIILTIAEALIANIPEILGAIVVLIFNIIRALTESLPDIAALVIEFLVNLANDFGDMLFDMFGEQTAQFFASVKNFFANIGQWIADKANDFINRFVNFLNAIVAFLENPKEGIRNAIEFIKNAISQGIANVKNFLSNAKDFVTNVFTNIKTFITNTFNNLKTFIPNTIQNIRTNFERGFNLMKDKVTSVFNNIKQTIQNAINTVKRILSGEISFPKIKLPHFSISGEFSLDPPSIPTISVDWYKKAYEDAYILNSATIFGAANGKLLGGGEGNGSEVVVGTNKLLSMMKQAVGTNARPINIYIQAADGMDIRELAKEVGRELQNELKDKESVYA